MKEQIIYRIKQERVLCAALILAFLSMVLVPPDATYLTYIDFRTLAILFCLMGVMAGFSDTGFFRWVAQKLLGRVSQVWQLVAVLVLLCFFSAMVMTNDVALITFVPFTLVILDLIGPQVKKKLLIPIVVMQTIAANLGSMLTPIGNPQNLYLYGKSGMGLGSFVLLMLPYTLFALVILLVWSVLQARRCSGSLKIVLAEKIDISGEKVRLIAYSGLFFLALLTVIRLIPYGVTLAMTTMGFWLIDREIFRRIDYGLLLTFVGFFVFIGNMGRVPAFYQMLQQIVEGRELLVAIATSQVISNVPAALLLSGFTDNYDVLIVGVNLGGLGTLIASMASLISYKFIVRKNNAIRQEYFCYFTIANICFLVLLLIFAFLCS